MSEFKKLCHEVESLSPADRRALLAEKALKVTSGLNNLNLTDIHPIETLASFIIGSVVSDGSISEKDYMYIYPALAETFGGMCDLAGIKTSFKVSKDVRTDINTFTRQMVSIISKADTELANDIVLLCLLVTSADAKISRKEKKYIKQLCKA